MGIVQEFQATVRRGRSLVVVGAGVSFAATGDPKSTWNGLLRSGVEYAQALNKLEPGMSELCTSYLDSRDSSAPELLAVASEVARALGAPEGAEFEAWLHRDVGYLQAKSTRVLDALLALGVPLLTTNYDDLLEKAGNRDHVTWMQPGHLQAVLAGQSDAIGHFHGYYREPHSVILSQESYDLLLEDENIVNLRNAMSTLNSVIYVGFGAGLDDPNFASLRRWIASALPSQVVRHFRLCRSDEWESLSLAHAGESLVPVPYGDQFDDLAPFLEGLETPGTLVPEFAPSQVLESINAHVRGESVLGVHIAGLDRSRFSEILIPPVLLPMGHEQYVAASRRKGMARPERCDLTEELARPRLLVAADENSGLSSALSWIVAKQHLAYPELIPLVINYRQLGAGQRPLDTEVRKQLRQVGYAIGDKAALPRLALAVDNIDLANEKKRRRFVAELDTDAFAHVTLGCRSGVEIELQPLLNACDTPFAQRYVGRLSRDDVRQLASLVDGPRSKQLAQKAIGVAKGQHLPTTPFTFSMIMSALLRGESLLSATSQTALLDAYVALLMGWGREDDDSRFGMDAFGRSFVVERLAELFVHQRRGSLPQTEVVAELDSLFAQFEWTDSPIDTLIDLKNRRLLVIRGTEVAFAQSSYLHLFAAKRAVRSTDFMKVLRASALYFAPIIQHYAALRRDDGELLREIAGLLEGFAQVEDFDSGIFGADERKNANQSISRALLRFQNENSAVATVDEDAELVPLDHRSDVDVEPFPLSPIEDAPPISRMISTLSLVSTVLRDTEMLPDVALRRGVLGQLLVSWANLVYAMEHDGDFREFVDDLARELADEFEISASKRDEFSQRLVGGTALSFGMAGVTTHLSSQKLSVSLEACLSEATLEASAGPMVIGAALAFDVQSPGWAELFVRLGRQHGTVPAVHRVLRRLAHHALVFQTLEPSDEELLLDFVVEMTLGSAGRLEPSEIGRARDQIRSKILGARMTRTRAALPAGRSVLSATELDEQTE